MDTIKNAVTMKKLNALETLYRKIVYHDPTESWCVTRWLWRKLSAMYDALDLDF